MKLNERAAAIVSALEQEYADPMPGLDYTPDNAWQLLVAVRLAAQCTDARVNLVTPALFKKYPGIVNLAAADVSDIERMVQSCGLGASKARDIKACMTMLHEVYGDRIPDTMEQLLKLPGVGRKSANLILGDVYRQPAIVCDTHCIRICRLLELIDTGNPAKAEHQLRGLIAPEKSNDFCHRLVLHGRAVCVARRPQCGRCCLSAWCPSSCR